MITVSYIICQLPPVISSALVFLSMNVYNIILPDVLLVVVSNMAYRMWDIVGFHYG